MSRQEERRAMTLDEAMAENARLEGELRTMTMENVRLRNELDAARSGASCDADDIVDAAPFDALRSSEVKLDFPGVVSIRLKGRVAERFAGLRGVPCVDPSGGC